MQSSVIRTTKAILGATIIFIILSSGDLHAAVQFSERAPMTMIDGPQNIRKQSYWPHSTSMQKGDILRVEVTIKNAIYNDLKVMVCPSSQMALWTSGRNANCLRQDGRKFIDFEFRAPANDTYYVVLDNTYANFITKKTYVKISTLATLPPQIKLQLEDMLLGMETATRSMFISPEFNLQVIPCGHENAFSEQQTGNITFCSELFFKLAKSRNIDVIIGVFFHELSHTLLNLWGLPGWNNEETADEFSTVMLYYGGRQEKSYGIIKWLSQSDSAAQARYMINYGDKHPLPVQRIRNIQAILDNPAPVVQRWNRLLYPHMTDEFLQEIIRAPYKYASPQLAGEILSQRATNPVVTPAQNTAPSGWEQYQAN